MSCSPLLSPISLPVHHFPPPPIPCSLFVTFPSPLPFFPPCHDKAPLKPAMDLGAFWPAAAGLRQSCSWNLVVCFKYIENTSSKYDYSELAWKHALYYHCSCDIQTYSIYKSVHLYTSVLHILSLCSIMLRAFLSIFHGHRVSFHFRLNTRLLGCFTSP